MQRLLVAALAALIALTVPACATQYVYIPIYIPAGPVMVPAADPGDYSKIKKVAVISGIGTKFEMVKTEFIADKTALLKDADGWQIDGYIKNTLKKYLGSKFEFVDVPYNPAGLEGIRPTIWHAGELAKFLKPLPKQDIDAFIVIRPNVQGGIRLETSRSGSAVLWVDYHFDIIDAKTLKTIGESTSRYQVREGAAPGWPGLVLKKDYAFSDTPSVAADKIEPLHKMTMEMLDVTLVETIRSLNFGVTLPAIGDHSLLPPPPASRSSGVHSIAVISAVGDRLKLYVPGGTFTKDTNVNVPMPDSGIDAAVEAQVKALLGKSYVFKDAPADRTVLAGKWWGAKDGKPFIQVPQTQDVDAYLLILKDAEKIIDGPGIYHDGNWVNDWTFVACNYLVILVDAHTGEPIIAHRGVMNSKTSHANPSFKVPNTVWPKALDKVKRDPKVPVTLTPEAQTTVKDALLQVLGGSLPETLYRMGLDVGDQTAKPAEGK